MKTSQIRTEFLEFFRSKGHEIVASSSLVPAGDPTLLFVNAGMVQFKDCFLGSDKRAYKRATTCQKCLRISGKHNDLENVGRTARHHTFFEMLGNFSFGDYFKEDAIKFAWEFLTVRLGLPKNRLWVTVYQDDDEAAEMWGKHTDVLKGRVLRFGKEENFWAMGETGPCGPCSEIHYYLGDNVEGQSEEEFRKNTGTYVEIWNLVFMQFNRDVSGKLEPLPKPSVDTGMGLERISAVKQGKLANYDTDLLRGIITSTEKLSGKKYVGTDYTERDVEVDEQYGLDVAFRVIADHVRAVAFLISDGVAPGSDGRGYVLRRLIRRACRHGRNLGFRKAFLHEIAAEVVTSMGEAYPELRANKDRIQKLTKIEEEKFIQTLDSGIAILKKEVANIKSEGGHILSGKSAFELHDTFGFPLDLTQDILRSSGLSVDLEGFESEMESQRERSRSARSAETELILQRSVKPLPSKFVGYEFAQYESKVVGIFGKDGERKCAKAGEELAIITSETPFYAESGGQVGDTGSITTNNASLEVYDTQRVGQVTIVHLCRVIEGEVASGDNVRLEIAEARRKRLRLNHSATHLLHLALREVLGTHVKQAGSRVSDQTLRFDFNHHAPLSASEIREIETIVNDEVRSNHPVVTDVLPIEEAKKSGAIALFGEKYGDLVRVVQIGPRSREFCGGTHTERSGDIGLVAVGSEGSISAGVRRIEAYAGPGSLAQISQQRDILRNIAGQLRASERELSERLERLLERNRTLEQEVEKLTHKSHQARGGDLSGQARTLKDGTRVVASVVEEATPKQLREMADDLRQRLGSSCIALGSVSDGRAIVLAAVSDDRVSKYNAGELVRELSKILGGKGGGRADLAQAGGGDPSKLKEALKRFEELVQ